MTIEELLHEREGHVGLIVDRDLAEKMLDQAFVRGIHNPERSRNEVGDLEEYIIQLVSDDIDEKI